MPSESAPGQDTPVTRRRQRGQEPAGRGWSRWLGEPRAAVLVVLFLIILVGGGRKLLRGWRARGAIGRLGDEEVTAQEVAAAVEFGRAGLIDLFRILGTAGSAEVREAAGQALAVLWARDELIAEEEQAVVRRGFTVDWRARRRYPRGLQGAIPIAVSYGVPFLGKDAEGISPEHLEWSHTILGARRAGLEVPTPWTAGPGHAAFRLIPDDFETDGPHRLILKTRVRTCGLSSAWELDLPQLPLTFEFDPRLMVDSLLTLPDAARAEVFAQAVRLVVEPSEESRGATFLDLNAELALRAPPVLEVTAPLPCDLAHSAALEIESIPGRFAAGEVILSGQGLRSAGAGSGTTTRTFALGPIAPVPREHLDHPGRRRIRVILTADADRGWADPDIRSIWPESIVTDWVEVQVVRR
jgi:hypothetical protein